jgi:hypothetical protein
MYTALRAIGILALAVVAGCIAAVDEPEPRESGETAAKEHALRIDLRVKNPVIKPGADPEIQAFLVNDGNQAETVVLPGDGSDCGWRTPVVCWQPERSGVVGRCGNINSLKPAEVVQLEPGKRIELDGWLGRPSLAEVGKHRVSVELDHQPNLEWRGLPLGQHDAAAMARIRASRPFKATSNVVEIEVRR